MTGNAEFEQVAAWFAERGFGLHFETRASETWADLTRLPSSSVVAPNYGRGATVLDAALSAKKRFEVEQ